MNVTARFLTSNSSGSNLTNVWQIVYSSANANYSEYAILDTSGAIDTTYSSGGGIAQVTGRVTINTCGNASGGKGGVCNPPSANVYTSRSLAFKSSQNTVYVQLESNGMFSAFLQAGTYSVNMTGCAFTGCNSLPENFTIYEGRQNTINITIGTGAK
jgi:hypothetical protein